MKVIQTIIDSIGDQWMVLGDVLEYCSMSRGKSSRYAKQLPPRYAQQTEIPTSSGSQRVWCIHKIGVLYLLATLDKDNEVSELFKYLTDAQTDEIDFQLEELPKTTRVREGNTRSVIHHKYVTAVLGAKEKAIKDRGTEPREITVAGGKKEVHIPNGRGGGRVFRGSMEQYLSLGEPGESHVKYPPKLPIFTYTDDKGNLRERNTNRIIQQKEITESNVVDGVKPDPQPDTDVEYESAIATVRQEELPEDF